MRRVVFTVLIQIGHREAKTPGSASAPSWPFFLMHVRSASRARCTSTSTCAGRTSQRAAMFIDSRSVLVAPGAGEGTGIGSPAVVIDTRWRRGNGLLAVIARIAFLTLVMFGTLDRLAARGIELLGTGKRLGRPVIVALQHRVFQQVTLKFLLHLDRRKLQEFD